MFTISASACTAELLHEFVENCCSTRFICWRYWEMPDWSQWNKRLILQVKSGNKPPYLYITVSILLLTPLSWCHFELITRKKKKKHGWYLITCCILMYLARLEKGIVGNATWSILCCSMYLFRFGNQWKVAMWVNFRTEQLGNLLSNGSAENELHICACTVKLYFTQKD